MIELKSISKIYTKGNTTFTALNDISFNINKGDYCTVVGPSGAGKSTLLHIIGGLIHPDSGLILYNGTDIYHQNINNLNLYRKKHLGFVFQQFYLMPYLTVFDNIKLACHNKNQIGDIGYFLEKFSLGEMKNKYPSELSVGEKQRTAFIRAIITNPEILLADEPTGNLDPGNSETLMNLISDHHKNKGTVIFVTHDPAMSKYSTMNITLEKGMIHRIDNSCLSATQK
jgi:putative ABC transport system ATP-binding protein